MMADAYNPEFRRPRLSHYHEFIAGLAYIMSSRLSGTLKKKKTISKSKAKSDCLDWVKLEGRVGGVKAEKEGKHVREIKWRRIQSPAVCFEHNLPVMCS